MARKPVPKPRTDLPDIGSDLPTLDFEPPDLGAALPTLSDELPTMQETFPDDDIADPDEMEPTAAAIVEANINAVQSDFIRRAKAEERRLLQTTDSEYWVCVCFETRAQKEEFLRALKLTELGDKHIDGLAAAAILGIKLQSPRAQWSKVRLDPKLAAMAKEEDS